MKRLVVCKFGGSSLADAARFRRVAEILRRNPARKYIVVSAPGARFPGDAKLTDRLLRARLSPGWAREREWAQVCARFREIAWGLSLDAPEEDLEKARAALEADRAAAASRGEWLCARMLAAYLKLPFVDAAEVIRFRAGVPDPQASYALLKKLPREGAVLPGFYGAEADGSVAVFPRGGSDITGAWTAAALQADAYENWTDVDGFFSADPALVTGARPIAALSPEQAEKICRAGVGVLHWACSPPGRGARFREKHLSPGSARHPHRPGRGLFRYLRRPFPGTKRPCPGDADGGGPGKAGRGPAGPAGKTAPGMQGRGAAGALPARSGAPGGADSPRRRLIGSASVYIGVNFFRKPGLRGS